MLEKSIIEKLKEARNDHKMAIVSFFNDGSISRDENFIANKAKSIGLWENEFTLDVMKDAASSYSRTSDFDNITMGMLMGLVYNIDDVTEDNVIKDGAEPLKNIVRYYTMHINSYLNGDKTNSSDYYKYGINRQGFLRYNDFVRYVKRHGLTFEGPSSFEELKQRILMGEVFDINVSADLTEEKPLVRTLK